MRDVSSFRMREKMVYGSSTQKNQRYSKASFAVLVAMLVAGCGKADTLQNLEVGSFAEPPDTMTVVIKNYMPQSGAAFQHLFVSNFTVRAEHGQLAYSSARDGMSDIFKSSVASTYNFMGISPESAVAGFADLLVFNLGVKQSQQNRLFCGSGQMASSSGDALIYNDVRPGGSTAAFLGLRDCEKIYLGLNPSKFENAGNGIPDYMKLHCGLNPANENDAYISTAADGVANIDKCKRNIPIDESAFTQPNQLFAYHYETQLNDDGTSEFKVSNIPILDNGADNFLAFYVTETGLSGKAPALFTAFAILKSGYKDKTLNIQYWATTPAKFINQEIAVP